MKPTRREATRASLTEFKEHLLREEKSPHTIAQYLREVEAFYLFLPEGKEITKERVISYKLALQERYPLPNTVNAKLCAVNAFLSFCGCWDCRVKAIRVQRKMFRDVARELSHGEYLRLVEAARRKKDKRLFLLLQTICSSGIRISELRFITLEGVQGNCAEVTAKGKTRKIFLPKKLRRELLNYGKERGIKSGPIFVSRNGNPLDRSNIWHEMKGLCESAHVAPGKVFPHNLRHLFARCFYEVKKDLAHLADILGHTSVETTRIYTLSSGREHERIISSLHLVI